MTTRRLVTIISACAISFVAMVSFAAGSKMKITSPAFQQDGSIPKKYACDGANMNPSLRFEQVPNSAKSLALIVDDPDARGGVFTHWLVWNIDPKTTDIAEGSGPKGVQGGNGFGNSSYGGPCPPSGMHRYFFKVFALDRELDLPAGSKRAQLDAAMQGHVLAQGELMGRYVRSH